MVKILGLDISSVNTGYCVFSNGRFMKSSVGTINPDSKRSYGERLLYFEEEVIRLVQKHKPDKVIIEDIFKGPNITTFKVLAMFRGVCIKVIFEELGFDPISVMPSEARKLVGVDGIKKEDAFEFVVKKYKLNDYDFDKDNNITDAIVLALSGHKMETLGLTEKDLKKKKKRKKRRKKKK